MSDSLRLYRNFEVLSIPFLLAGRAAIIVVGPNLHLGKGLLDFRFNPAITTFVSHAAPPLLEYRVIEL